MHSTHPNGPTVDLPYISQVCDITTPPPHEHVVYNIYTPEAVDTVYRDESWYGGTLEQ